MLPITQSKDGKIASRGRALIYCRISTKGQLKEPGVLGSLETQEQANIEFARKQGFTSWEVAKEQHTGAELWDRKVLTQIRADIKAGKYDAIISYSIDRLTRVQAHLFILSDEFTRAGIQMLFATETLDQTLEGELLMSVKSYVAAVEREKIRERTMRGKKARLLSGKIHNSGAELYGYARDKAKGIRIINDEEAAVIRRIFNDFTYKSKSISQLERELNTEGVPSPGSTRPNHRGNSNFWHRKTIHRILLNPAYKGETIQWRSSRTKDQFGKTIFHRRSLEESVKLGKHVTPAIVSPVVWDMAQSIQKERNKYNASAYRRNERFQALLRGMVYCLECGEPMYTFDSGKVTGYYYRCGSYCKPMMRGKCKGRVSRLSLLELAVWEEIKRQMQEENLVRKQLEFALLQTPEDDTRDAITSCESTLAKIDKGQQRLVKSLTLATDETAELIERELLTLGERRRDVQKELDSLRARRGRVDSRRINIEWVLDNLHMIAQRLEQFDFNDRRAFLDAMSLRVEASADQFRFSFNIPTHPEEGTYVVSGQISGCLSFQPLLFRQHLARALSGSGGRAKTGFS